MTTTQIQDELDRLQELCDAATAGPWRFWDNRGVQCTRHTETVLGPYGWRYEGKVNVGEPLGESHQGVKIDGLNRTLTMANDSKFIAASRTALPRVIAALKVAIEKIDHGPGPQQCLGCSACRALVKILVTLTEGEQ